MLFFWLCSAAEAQSDKPAESGHQLGLHAGTTTGIGVSYRYWPRMLGLQVTLLPYKYERGWAGDQESNPAAIFPDPELPEGQLVSLGLSGLLRIKQFNKTNMFAYWGNHLLLLEDQSAYCSGIGIGFYYEAPVCFNLMLGYGAYDITNSVLLFPAAEIGLYYRFRNKN